MERRKLSSVLFCSGIMLLYFFGRLYDRTTSRRGLALLLQSFIRAPYAEPVKKIAPLRGHAYVIHLEQDVLSTAAGRSPFLLLENGRALPHPGARSHDEIAEHGGGRYLHMNRRIFFAPTDNADLRQQPRQYTLFEALSESPKKNRRLAEINRQRADYANAGLWLLDKLLAYLPDHVRTGRIAAAGAAGMTVADIAVDTASFDFGIVQIGLATARWSVTGEPWRQVDIGLDAIRWPGIDRPMALTLTVEVSPSCALRLRAATLTVQGAAWAALSVAWQENGLAEARAVFHDLATIRQGLAEACGGDDACAAWLDGMLAAMRSGDLSFGCRIDDTALATLRDALMPGARIDSLEAEIRRINGDLALCCGGTQP